MLFFYLYEVIVAPDCDIVVPAGIINRGISVYNINAQEAKKNYAKN